MRSLGTPSPVPESLTAAGTVTLVKRKRREGNKQVEHRHRQFNGRLAVPLRRDTGGHSVLSAAALPSQGGAENQPLAWGN